MNLAQTFSFALLIIFVVSHSTLAQSPHCEVQWDPPLTVSLNSVFATTPQLSVDGDTVHLIWYEIDFFGTSSHNGIQYSRSTDGGRNFSAQVTLSTIDTANSFPGLISSSDANVYVSFVAAVDTFYGTALLHSTDAGTTWQPLQRLRKNVKPMFIEAKDSLVFIHYHGVQPVPPIFGLLRSSNSGLTWTNLPLSFGFTSMVIKPDKLHAVSITGDRPKEVYYYASANLGATWFFQEVLSNEFISSGNPKIVANENNNIYVVWREPDSSSVMLRRSRNNGAFWLSPIKVSEQGGATSVDVAASEEFVTTVGDYDYNNRKTIPLHSSNDFGSSFCPVDTSISDSGVSGSAVKILSTNLHVTWSKSVDINSGLIFYRHGTLTKNPDIIDRPPQQYSLLQNYPNPFNGITHIRYDISAPSSVTLNVYNILGQKISTLVNGFLSEGRYEAIFDASKLASGVYFYRLQTKDVVTTKKLVITK